MLGAYTRWLRTGACAATIVLAASLSGGCNRNESPGDVQRNVAKEEAENGAELRKQRAEADYDSAKQKCEAMSGKGKDACVEQARADRDEKIAAAESRRSNQQD